MVQGEWEFYNAMLLTPDDFHCHVMPEKSGYARSFNIDSTNHTWQKENNEPGANGNATYRLKLKLNALQHPLLVGMRLCESELQNESDSTLFETVKNKNQIIIRPF